MYKTGDRVFIMEREYTIVRIMPYNKIELMCRNTGRRDYVAYDMIDSLKKDGIWRDFEVEEEEQKINIKWYKNGEFIDDEKHIDN